MIYNVCYVQRELLDGHNFRNISYPLWLSFHGFSVAKVFELNENNVRRK